MEDLRCYDVFSDDSETRRSLFWFRLLEESGDGMKPLFALRGFHDTVGADTLIAYFFKCYYWSISCFVCFNELARSGDFSFDEIITEKNKARFIPDEIAGSEYSISITSWYWLPDIGYTGEIGYLFDLSELLGLSFLYERFLELK